MARHVVPVPLHELTDRQIHLHLIGLYESQVATLERLEKFMSDLTQSVDSLQAAVDSVNARVAGQVQSLTDALQAANDAMASDELDDTAREQALQSALADAQSAADRINSQVDELNQIGANPSTPVEPDQNPTDPGTAPDDQPHPDQTLPGDLPTDQPTA